MADKIKVKDTVNPFARPQFQKPDPAVKKTAPAPKKKTKSWSDTLGDSLLHVGDYLRGVKRN